VKLLQLLEQPNPARCETVVGTRTARVRCRDGLRKQDENLPRDETMTDTVILILKRIASLIALNEVCGIGKREINEPTLVFSFNSLEDEDDGSAPLIGERTNAFVSFRFPSVIPPLTMKQ